MRSLPLGVAIAAIVAASAAQAEPATYHIDPAHTFVNFEVLRHAGTSTTRGRFDRKEGSVIVDAAARRGKVDLAIDLASVSTGVPPFDAHLRGKDFLNAGEHPTARFTSDELSFDGDRIASVKGVLSMNGKDQPVTLAATHFNCYQSPLVKKEVCGGDFETTIVRSQWGMGYGLPGIPDSIRLLSSVEAIRQP